MSLAQREEIPEVDRIGLARVSRRVVGPDRGRGRRLGTMAWWMNRHGTADSRELGGGPSCREKNRELLFTIRHGGATLTNSHDVGLE